jgi:siroheme synthase-like protein
MGMMDAPTSRYFPVGLDLQGARAVVVGGDAEAADKAGKLAGAGAEVTVLWPEVGDGVRALAEAGAVAWIPRAPTADDLPGARVVLLTEQDPALAQWLHGLGRTHGFWLCALDQPDHCDWVNLGQVRAGPIRIAIGSDGGAPALVRRLREALQGALDGRFAAFAERLVTFRQGLKKHPPEERRRRLALALQGFQLEIRVRYPPWESNTDGGPPPA